MMLPLDQIRSIPMFRTTDPALLRIEPLDGLTNRSFRVSTGVEWYVLRIPGTGTERYIDRRREAYNAALAADLGIAPERVWQDAERGIMLCRHIEGARSLNEADLARSDTLRRAAELLRRLHHSGAVFEGQMVPSVLFEHYLSLARQAGSAPAGPLTDLCQTSPRLQQLLMSSVPTALWTPCHVDPVPANFVADDSRLWLLDWEYAAMTDPMWDLACLALEANLNRDQGAQLLYHYGASVGTDSNRRFREQLLLVSVVGAAWTVLQIALGNAVADFQLDYERRLVRLTGLLADAETTES